MALTSVSVILTVFVLNLHYRDPRSSAVPQWLRRLAGLGPDRRRHRRRRQHGLIFRRRDDTSPVDDDDNEDGDDDRPRPSFVVDGYVGDAACRYAQNVSLRMTMENLADELEHELDGRHEEASSSSSGRGGIRRPTSSSSSADRPSSILHRQAALSNREILKALQKVVERYEVDDDEGTIVYEWRQMAVAVDRILFWVFLVGTLSSTVVILGIVPLTSDS